MDFALSEEQQALFDMARDFGAEKIAPFAAEWEREGAFPRSILEEAGALGLGTIYVSEEAGGAGKRPPGRDGLGDFSWKW